MDQILITYESSCRSKRSSESKIKNALQLALLLAVCLWLLHQIKRSQVNHINLCGDTQSSGNAQQKPILLARKFNAGSQCEGREGKIQRRTQGKELLKGDQDRQASSYKQEHSEWREDSEKRHKESISNSDRKEKKLKLQTGKEDDTERCEDKEGKRDTEANGSASSNNEDDDQRGEEDESNCLHQSELGNSFFRFDDENGTPPENEISFRYGQ